MTQDLKTAKAQKSDFEKYQDRKRGWLDAYNFFILSAHHLANEGRWSEINNLPRP